MKLNENTAKGLHAEIVRFFPKARFKKYLDVGCGSGALLKRLRKIYDDGYGIDMNPKNFQFKDKNVKFIKGNLNEKLPFKNKEFDLITCIEVIEHVESQFLLMREISLNLNKKGLLVVSSPNIYNFWSRILFLLNGKFINYMNRNVDDHINPLIQNIFEKKMVEQNGLKIVGKYYSSMHVPFTNISIPIRTKCTGNNVIYFLKK